MYFQGSSIHALSVHEYEVRVLVIQENCSEKIEYVWIDQLPMFDQSYSIIF